MPTSDIETLILRFRDLSTSSGETIAFHQQVITDKNSVWWGWWHKEGETIPDEAFRKIAQAASALGGLDVFLFHSDQQQFFEAHCVKLFWDIEHQRTHPREQPELVPEYYEGRPCLAWFRFTSIRPHSEPPLKDLSYVEIPELFTGGEPGYQLFDGKVIASTEELRQQNRTIWFVRTQRDGDPTHEIKMFDAHQIVPSDFPRDHIVSSSTDLLWVSDLHFSEDRFHAFTFQAEGDRSAWESIRLVLDDEKIENVAGVIASGDFAWKASPAEFDQARTLFFDPILGWNKKLKNYHLLVCPGNHDLRYSEEPAEKNQPVSVASEKARAAYEDFYEKLFFKRPNEFLSCGRRFLLGGAIPVEIACLNSCLLNQKDGLFQGQGFVGEKQMRDAARELGWDPHQTGPRAVRIVVLHHHLLPVSYSEAAYQGWQYSVTLDAESLMRWVLKHDVDLVLHGHQHQPFYTQVVRSVDLKDTDTDSRTTTIVGMGSTGVDLGHLGEERTNMFALLQFGVREVRIRFFSIDRRNLPKDLFDFRVDLSARSRLA